MMARYLNIVSLNCNGLGDPTKRNNIFNHFVNIGAESYSYKKPILTGTEASVTKPNGSRRVNIITPSGTPATNPATPALPV